MKRIAIFGNKSQKRNFAPLQQFFELLAEHADSIALSIDYRYYEFMHRVITVPPLDVHVIAADEPVCADLVLSIGGDGSFLTTARRVGALSIPIMGINTGHLGYLAAADITHPHTLVEEIVRDNYDVQPRSVIEVLSDDAELPTCPFALNEVAVLKQNTASMITVDTTLDGEPLACYRCDGLIVSTPTGSTGYNLSVGGPIIAPTAADWVISPIAPHSLNMRPLVVGDDSVIGMITSSRSSAYLLSIDGKSVALPVGSHVTLRKAPYNVQVVIPKNHNFVDTLRRKLLWGIDGL
ncbi:MAG: NAD kinase [Paramuribaculum sp.]|nr:NAD kinase [Paramuribaculum sp.]